MTLSSYLQEYTTQLAHCLMELQEASNCTVQQQLQAWILEVHFLHVAFAVRLPSRLKEVTSLRYDDYQLCPEQSSEFYDSLLVSMLDSSEPSKNASIALSSHCVLLGDGTETVPSYHAHC